MYINFKKEFKHFIAKNELNTKDSNAGNQRQENSKACRK